MVYALNKPFGILSQFSSEGNHPGILSLQLNLPKDVWPIGRLDRDSEGLLLLTDDMRLRQQLTDPKENSRKTYWVQVEGEPDETMLAQLRDGVRLKDGITRPAVVTRIDPPSALWPRNPPVRFRKTVADSWLDITISEGRNRQVRRMTAATGAPTLRLIRHRVGSWALGDLASGAWRTG